MSFLAARRKLPRASSRLLIVAQLFVTFELLVAQDRWQVQYADVGSEDYELTMSWYHNPELAIVGRDLSKNPGNQDGSSASGSMQGVCDSDSTATASDGKLYWVPRIFQRSVPSDVTAKTGIHFASVDWQPCGHKDVVICHGESHYDFHLYYVPAAEVNAYTCDNANPVCPDLAHAPRNVRFFKLMKGNLPRYASKANGQPGSVPAVKNFDFCVDPTSAMPNSGIHYGDKSETLKEWKEPVTVMGSYDCKLTFFEPMFSWKWVQGKTGSAQYPTYESGTITYDEKNFRPLPDSWSVTVSPECASGSGAPISECKVTVVVRGKRCLGGSCGALPQNCGQQKNCISNQPMGRMDDPTPPAPAPAIVPSSTTASGTTAPVTSAAAIEQSSSAAATGTQGAAPAATVATRSSIWDLMTSNPNLDETTNASNVGSATNAGTQSASNVASTSAAQQEQPAQVHLGVQRITVSGLSGYIVPSGMKEAIRAGFARFLTLSEGRIVITNLAVVRAGVSSSASTSSRRMLQTVLDHTEIDVNYSVTVFPGRDASVTREKVRRMTRAEGVAGEGGGSARSTLDASEQEFLRVAVNMDVGQNVPGVSVAAVELLNQDGTSASRGSASGAVPRRGTVPGRSGDGWLVIALSTVLGVVASSLVAGAAA